MPKPPVDCRAFLRELAGSAAALSILPQAVQAQPARPGPPKLRFAVIGINHGHINSQVNAVLRGGGELVVGVRQGARAAGRRSRRRSRRRSSPAARTRSSRTPSIQLVLSAAIPDERAPLGIRVMQHGKDYMADKPGITTLEQLAEVRKVQAADQADLLDHVQRAVRESRHGQGRRTGQGRAPSARWCRPSASARTGSTPTTRPDVVLRQAALRRHPVRHRARTRPTSSCSSPARRRPRSSRRRSATSTPRSTRSSRTSAT